MYVCSGCVADHAIRLSGAVHGARSDSRVSSDAVLVVDGLCVLFVMCLLLCALPTGWTVPRSPLSILIKDTSGVHLAS